MTKQPITETDIKIISNIVSRASAIYTRVHGRQLTRKDERWLVMDILAVHGTTPLDLEGLASAKDVHLIHDVFGINRHLDRDTKVLGGCFVPRFTAKDHTE